MKITRISVYQIDVPIKPATISHDRVMSPKTSPIFSATVCRSATQKRLPILPPTPPACWASASGHRSIRERSTRMFVARKAPTTPQYRSWPSAPHSTLSFYMN